MSRRTPSPRSTTPFALLAVLLVVAQPAFVGAASADTGTVVEQEGDVATFTVALDGSNEATVQVGTEAVNYEVNLTVRGNGDEVTVRMNTYEAGGWRGATPEEVFSAENGRVVSATRATPTLDAPIDTGSYRIYTRIDGQLTDFGVLTLEERATGNLTVFTAPDGASMDSVADVTGNATAATRIARGDYLVARVDASGLSGYVRNVDDVQQGTAGVHVDVYAERPNARGDPVDLQSGSFFRDGDRLYLAFDTDDLDAEPGDGYRLEFRIDGDENPYVKPGKTERLTRGITIRPRRIVFTEDPVVVDATANQRIDLRTSVAPGTRLTLELLSESLDEPFVKRTTVTVAADGTASAAFDFSGVSGRTAFDLAVKGEGVKTTAYVGGDPDEPTETTPPTTATAEPTPTPTPVETTAPSAASPTPEPEPSTAPPRPVTTLPRTEPVGNESVGNESTGNATVSHWYDAGATVAGFEIPIAKIGIAVVAVILLDLSREFW